MGKRREFMSMSALSIIEIIIPIITIPIVSINKKHLIGSKKDIESELNLISIKSDRFSKFQHSKTKKKTKIRFKNNSEEKNKQHR